MSDLSLFERPGPAAPPPSGAGPATSAVALRTAIGLATEWRPLAELHTIVPDWRRLTYRAIEPNIFYEPNFALPAATAFAPDAGAVLVWTQSRTLVGLFPVRVERCRYGLPFPIVSGWTHAYAPLGVPLVDRDLVEPVVQGFLDHVLASPGLPNVLLLSFLPQHGPFAAALGRALAGRRARVAVMGAHRRALLEPGCDRAHYLERSIGARRRKELRRQRRRLEGLGPVSPDTAATPDEVGAALADFLSLEADGWKGRRGSAVATQAKIRTFIETAIPALRADGMAQIHRLLVGGRAVAAAITLHRARRAWFFKIAYDENLARASPGVQLTLDVTSALLRETSIAAVDSCATQDHPMIDHLWRERLGMTDLLVAEQRAAVAFALACRLERLRRAAIATVKRWRGR
jgi:CelD/BcsL family acetyltransferase involved in cellulose biosynthesis